MDIRKLRTIVDIFESSSLSEMEFVEGEERVRLVKAVAATALPATGAAAEDSAPPSEHNGTVVKSPMVGTVYLSPSPEKAPFARVGQRVNEGDTLCIIEAMKLMNEIPSPTTGIVKKVLISNAEPVSYGSELFVIE